MRRKLLTRRAGGFTLIEVMVALAIFAVLSVTLYRSLVQSVSLASELEQRTLAGWIARNALAELELEYSAPDAVLGAGSLTRTVNLAGQEWQVVMEIAAETPEPLRRVRMEVLLFDADGNERVLTTLESLRGAP